MLQFVFLISHILHSFLVLCELHNFWDSVKPWCILGIVSVPSAHGYNARIKENKISPRIAHTPNKREIFSENAIISLAHCEHFDMISTTKRRWRRKRRMSQCGAGCFRRNMSSCGNARLRGGDVSNGGQKCFTCFMLPVRKSVELAFRRVTFERLFVCF